MAEQKPVYQIRLFGEVVITDGEQCISESTYKAPQVWPVICYLVMKRRKAFYAKTLAEQLQLHERADEPAGYVRNDIFRFNQKFQTIFGRKLILGTTEGYRIDPSLEIQTDYEFFERLCNMKKYCADQQEKIRLLKETVQLYRGKFCGRACYEPWIFLDSLHYQEEYTKVILELLQLLGQQENWNDMRQYAAEALRQEVYQVDIFYLLWGAMRRTGSMGSAKYILQAAQNALQEREYFELMVKIQQAEYEELVQTRQMRNGCRAVMEREEVYGVEFKKRENKSSGGR